MLFLKILKENSHQFTVFLFPQSTAKQYSNIELSLSLYPLTKSIDAKNFRFEPYEDYVGELSEGRRSTYRILESYADNLFGIFLGGVISFFFFWVFPAGLLSVEAIVAILGAYAIGKELWQDLDQFLRQATREWGVRWTDADYFYLREDFGTLQRFWQLARQERYGYFLSLPKKIDFVAHSNSKTVDMAFTKQDLAPAGVQKTRILQIEFDPDTKVTDIQEKMMLIVRISIVKNFLVFRSVTEFYQSVNGKQVGSLDEQGTWRNDKVLVKNVILLGKIRWVRTQKLVDGKVLLFE